MVPPSPIVIHREAVFAVVQVSANSTSPSSSGTPSARRSPLSRHHRLESSMTGHVLVERIKAYEPDVVFLFNHVGWIRSICCICCIVASVGPFIGWIRCIRCIRSSVASVASVHLWVARPMGRCIGRIRCISRIRCIGRICCIGRIRCIGRIVTSVASLGSVVLLPESSVQPTVIARKSS